MGRRDGLDNADSAMVAVQVQVVPRSLCRRRERPQTARPLRSPTIHTPAQPIPRHANRAPFEGRRAELVCVGPLGAKIRPRRS